MRNHLKNETSPYLLQHADNPVDWYPWGEAAFQKAKQEDKPIFLSIGYSTCHWCHVMERESFEDREIADLLNRYFISIKVDKEERPDIDNVYMAVCQAFPGSGGWPISIFMTAGQKPFFAGTYFPKNAQYGSPGLKELLSVIHEKWTDRRMELLRSAEEITAALNRRHPVSSDTKAFLPGKALALYKRHYDPAYGGFGSAPKFPSPHNLLFLLQQYEKYGSQEALDMAETTLRHMYAGGLFDHIGYGFCRYSTDRFFLIPHFEKMLNDNALLILTYCKAYELTGNMLYRQIAEKTASYILTEMAAPEGGFYSAQDADSEGEEGKYYAFRPEEIVRLFGQKDGAAFNKHYGITANGNFEGKSIPNLLSAKNLTESPFESLLPKLRAYRQSRSRLLTDDKILTAWNALMIAALCALYRCTHVSHYLEAAKKTVGFIEKQLSDGTALYVSFCKGKRSGKGFLDDYASYLFALLALYDATFDRHFLQRAEQILKQTVCLYYDEKDGGFYLYGKGQEQLLFRPKESYDGAAPSGNSLMAYNLVRFHWLGISPENGTLLQKQLAYLSGEAERYPAGYAMFLTALSDYLDPPAAITIVSNGEDLSELPPLIPSGAAVKVMEQETAEYRLQNGETAVYVCQNHTCLPPVSKKEWIAKQKTVRPAF